MPVILAIETATDLASCALLTGGQEMLYREIPRGSGGEGQHSAQLLPQIKSMLEEAGLDYSRLDAVAFGAGPGAFTGLRMACAMAQGIGVAHDLPLIPVVTLESLVLQIRRKNPEAQTVLAMLDARMGEVYRGFYRVGEGEPEIQGAISLVSPENLQIDIEALALRGAVAGGNVFEAYPAIGEQLATMGDPKILSGIVPLAEDTVVRAAQIFQKQGGIDPADAAPLYVRDRVAKTVAERLAEGGKA